MTAGATMPLPHRPEQRHGQRFRDRGPSVDIQPTRIDSPFAGSTPLTAGSCSDVGTTEPRGGPPDFRSYAQGYWWYGTYMHQTDGESVRLVRNAAAEPEPLRSRIRDAIAVMELDEPPEAAAEPRVKTVDG